MRTTSRIAMAVLIAVVTVVPVAAQYYDDDYYDQRRSESPYRDRNYRAPRGPQQDCPQCGKRMVRVHKLINGVWTWVYICLNCEDR